MIRTRILINGLAAMLAVCSCSKHSDDEGSHASGPMAPDNQPMSFDGQSDQLKRTAIVATLDASISPGTNVIWCASFQSAWKALEELAGRPVVLRDAPPLNQALNDAADPRPTIPAEFLYITNGSVDNGIIDQIRQDLARRFPNKKPPAFKGDNTNSFLVYAYLEAEVKFPIPYCENPEAFGFTDSAGNHTAVRSFGLVRGDPGAAEARRQLCLVYRKGEWPPEEFAVDLCSNSSPSQIIVARIAIQPTLAAAVAYVEKGIVETRARAKEMDPYEARQLYAIQVTDSFLMPAMHWIIAHHYHEIENKIISNSNFRGLRLEVASQDIHFRLDRRGARLESESRFTVNAPPTEYHFDRPFLIYMKKRGADTPYFVMWVDNTELLTEL